MQKLNISFLISILFCLTAQSQSIEDGLYAMIYAEDHQLFIRLHADKTPMTVANFVGLAEGTITNAAFDNGQPFFDGSKFDRVVEGHVIQGGVPKSSNAKSAGYLIPNEIHPDLNHKTPGTMGMANAGPDTGSNVFYITLGDRSYLDGDYTVFGQLTTEVPYDLKLNTRIDSIRIVRVGAKAENFIIDDAQLEDLIKEVKIKNAQSRQEKSAFEEEYITSNYPNTQISESGWEFIELTKGKGKKVKKLEKVNLRFSGNTPQGVEFGSTEGCASYWLPAGEKEKECIYYPSKTSIVKGLDDAIMDMKVGSKWIVILKPEHAYGSAGFYPPLDWGNKRFHLSPNTTVIYNIEIMSK